MRTWPPSAHRGVVLVGQHPADLLGQPRRHGDGERAAGPQHPDQLGERADVVGDVLEHLGGDDASKVSSANGSRVASPRSTPTKRSIVDLAGLDHRRRTSPRGLHDLVGGVVEGDDVGAAAGALEGVAAEAGAEVEHEVARAAAPSSVEADGEHVRSRPFRRELGDVRRHRQHLAVLLDGELGAAPPRPAVEHALAAGGADAGAQLGVVEAAADRRGQRLGVAGRARQHGLAVGAGDLGQRAAVGGDERRAGGHRLDRRQAEALVEARHDGQLGLGVELDDALVGDAGDERRRASPQAELLDQVHALARLRLADDRQRDVALGAQLGQRLEQVGEALQGDVGRRGGDQPAGHARDVGQRPEQLGVDADGHEAHAVEVDAHVGVDVVDRVLATTTIRGIRRATRACILTNEYQRPTDQPLAPVRRVLHLEPAVDGDRVVERDDRRDLLLDAAGSRSRGTGCRGRGRTRRPRRCRCVPGPDAERQRLGERAGRELRRPRRSRSSVLSSQRPGIRTGKWSL